jgi:hypothetical protein
MRRFAIPLLFLLFACGSPKVDPAGEKTGLSDAEMKQFVAENPGMTKACLDEVSRSGILGYRPDDPACFEMMSARRWKGLWKSGWEWTNFCPAPARECSISAEHGDIWLEFAEHAYSGPELKDGLYEIEFIGRRTKVPGHFGHLGQYDHLMVADRVNSIRLLRAEPQE